MIEVTTHSLVKNEQNWIWFSLTSVIDQVTRALVYDDNSSDNTAKIISTINSPKLIYKKVQAVTPGDHTKIRNEMVRQTKTGWFVILDGDEVWNQKTFANFLRFLETQPQKILAVATRTRNCVGDVFHYQAESAGRYEILGRKGNLNIRAYRRLPGFHWANDYPLEAWCDNSGRPVNTQDDHLAFFDDFYWHMTFLPRTSDSSIVKGWRKVKLESGITVKDKTSLPEVFFSKNRPAIVADPLKKMPLWKDSLGKVILGLKNIRR